jgi:HK97 family phage portal protein
MDFLKRLFSGGGKKETTYNGGSWSTIYPADVAERNLLYNNKEWVFIAVDRIAKSLAGVRFKVMSYQRSGDDQEVFDGPLVDFLERPGSGFTGKDFIYLDTAYKELTGNAFWEIVGGRELKPLIPTEVKPIMSGTKLIGYKVHDQLPPRTLALSKVLHDRYIDPRKPYWGVGKLEKIARWVDTSFFANEFLRNFFVNGATFGGFIETEEESEDRIKLIKVGLANEHQGVQNAHKMAVLPKGSKFAPATANMQEMQFGETDDRYRDKILSGFGVPKTMVGLTTEVNRATAEASEYVFAKYTLKPIADDFVEFLNVNIAPLFDPAGKFYFTYEEFVPENMDIKLKEREISLAKQAYKTVNEVRAEIGLPPVEGGDTVYTPMGMPLGEQPPAPMAAPGSSDAKHRPAPRHIREALRRERLVEGIVTKAAEIATAHHDPDAESHKGFVARVAQHEQLVAGKVRDFNNRQEREVMDSLSRITKGVSKGDLFDMEGQVALLVDFVSPMLKGLLVEQGIEEYAAQGFPGAFDTQKSSVSRIVELAAKRLAKSYNNTTANLLKTALNEGISAGEDFTQLAARVKAVYEFSDQKRAVAVSRTESFYVANEGSREAYRQSGVVQSVRWYTAEDERVCPHCGPLNVRIIGINEVFFKKGEELTAAGSTLKLNYRTIDVPPLHTHCRCFIRPESIDVS